MAEAYGCEYMIPINWLARLAFKQCQAFCPALHFALLLIKLKTVGVPLKTLARHPIYSTPVYHMVYSAVEGFLDVRQ